ncbi:hypothetical protein HYR54_13670 [Candidatus Acetothermia bacterium]|nr:hypothetical protein [Candidatus Acetothermia bacterium]MBI3460674.1 hypothetical protein [Candidatus Acetothermia bacterium]MBI3661190.1 hypothetical protein [Candidatus Acetothermia bacterium]
MKKLAYGAIAVLLIALLTLLLGQTSIAQSGSDLAVPMIKIKPTAPEAGETTKIRATIANQGGSDALDAFDVVFEVDGEPIGRNSLTRLNLGQSRAVDFPWIATLGTHKIRVSIDISFSTVRDSNKENNQLTIEVNVTAPATVRSATRQIVEAFGVALEQAGKALNFEVSGDALKVYSDALNALTNTANALHDLNEDLQIIKSALPSALIQQVQVQKADAIAALYEGLADITLHMMGALSLGNFDGIIEQATNLRAKLVTLSQATFESISFDVLKPAVAQLDKLIPLAIEFKNVFSGGKGRDLATVGRELFEALLNYGAALVQAGQRLKQAAAEQAANFSDSTGNPVSVYIPGSPLVTSAANAHGLKLELWDANGQLVNSVQADGDRLEFNGMDSAGNTLKPGVYYYNLTIQNTVAATNELGRLIVSNQ